MSKNGFLKTIYILLSVLALATGWYILSDYDNLLNRGRVVNGKIFCGNDHNKYSWDSRECIAQAFKSCSPAVAQYREDGVAWEASGFDTKIEVIKKSQGCAFQYELTGDSFAGPYEYKGECLDFEIRFPSNPPDKRMFTLRRCTPDNSNNFNSLNF